jgi:hypothetical protein
MAGDDAHSRFAVYHAPGAGDLGKNGISVQDATPSARTSPVLGSTARALLPVDEHLLAATVHLTHRDLLPREPRPIDVADDGVAIAIGMLFELLRVQQLERDAGPT